MKPNSNSNTCANCDSQLVSKVEKGHAYLVCEGCKFWWNDKLLAQCTKARRPRPECHLLSLSYEPNGTDHHDLVLGLGSFRFRSDTYYYELDGPRDVYKSIQLMLESWLEDITRAAPSDTVILPHDFSDQYTGWLKCTLSEDDKWTLVPGWSDIEGWSFNPSDYREAAAKVNDFNAVDDSISYEATTSELRSDIESSIRALSELRDCESR